MQTVTDKKNVHVVSRVCDGTPIKIIQYSSNNQNVCNQPL